MSAQLSGIVEPHVCLQRDEALADLADHLARVHPHRRQLVASDAAAAYVANFPGHGFEPACAELLAAAGADLAEPRWRCVGAPAGPRARRPPWATSV